MPRHVEKLNLGDHTLDVEIKRCDYTQFDFGEVEDFVRELSGGREYQFDAIKSTLIYLWGGIYKDITELGAGVYSYYFWSFGNGTTHNFNSSGIFSYTVRQNSSWFLNLSESPSGTWIETYGTLVNVSGSNCPSQLTCNIYRNNTAGAVSNGVNVTLAAGYYNYTYNSTGNTNYSVYSLSNILRINSASSSVYTYLNHLRQNASVFTGNSIWLNATLITGSGNISLYKNGVKMKNSGMISYAWYVWDKNYVGKPTIEWIN